MQLTLEKNPPTATHLIERHRRMTRQLFSFRYSDIERLFRNLNAGEQRRFRRFVRNG